LVNFVIVEEASSASPQRADRHRPQTRPWFSASHIRIAPDCDICVPCDLEHRDLTHWLVWRPPSRVARLASGEIHPIGSQSRPAQFK
jgi:hypothetical protein